MPHRLPVRLAVVLDVVKLLKVFNVPEADVVVVRTRRNQLAAAVDVDRLDRERVLPDDSEDTARNEVHRAQNSVLAARYRYPLGDGDHPVDARLGT